MKNSRDGFVLPVILVIVALFVVTGGIYIYENKKTGESAQNQIDDSFSSTTKEQDTGPYAPGSADITEKDNGKTFSYTETSRFSINLDSALHPLIKGWDCLPSGTIGYVSNLSLRGPDQYPVGFEAVRSGSCKLINKDFSVTIIVKGEEKVGEEDPYFFPLHPASLVCLDQPKDSGLGKGYVCNEEGFGFPDFGYGRSGGGNLPAGASSKEVFPMTDKDMDSYLSKKTGDRIELIFFPNTENSDFSDWVVQGIRSGSVLKDIFYVDISDLEKNAKKVIVGKENAYQILSSLQNSFRLRTAVAVPSFPRGESARSKGFLLIDCYFGKPTLEKSCSDFLGHVFFSRTEGSGYVGQ